MSYRNLHRISMAAGWCQKCQMDLAVCCHVHCCCCPQRTVRCNIENFSNKIFKVRGGQHLHSKVCELVDSGHRDNSKVAKLSYLLMNTFFRTKTCQDSQNSHQDQNQSLQACLHHKLFLRIIVLAKATRTEMSSSFQTIQHFRQTLRVYFGLIKGECTSEDCFDRYGLLKHSGQD